MCVCAYGVWGWGGRQGDGGDGGEGDPPLSALDVSALGHRSTKEQVETKRCGADKAEKRSFIRGCANYQILSFDQCVCTLFEYAVNKTSGKYWTATELLGFIPSPRVRSRMKDRTL